MSSEIVLSSEILTTARAEDWVGLNLLLPGTAWVIGLDMASHVSLFCRFFLASRFLARNLRIVCFLVLAVLVQEIQ